MLLCLFRKKCVYASGNKKTCQLFIRIPPTFTPQPANQAGSVGEQLDLFPPVTPIWKLFGEYLGLFINKRRKLFGSLYFFVIRDKVYKIMLFWSARKTTHMGVM